MVRPGVHPVRDPGRDEIARLLWDVSDGQLLGLPWEHCQGPRRARYRRMANAVRALYAPRCCDSHGRNCEPPGELCCAACVEARHRLFDGDAGQHADGTVCVNPNLSPDTSPQDEYAPEDLAAALRGFIDQPRHVQWPPDHPAVADWIREKTQEHAAWAPLLRAMTRIDHVERGPIQYLHTEQVTPPGPADD